MFDEAGDGGKAGAVHEMLRLVQGRVVIADFGDAVAVDDDVLVMLRHVADRVHEVADMDDGTTRRIGDAVGQVERDIRDRAGFDVDGFERIGRLEQDRLVVGRPGREIADVRGVGAWRAERLTIGGDRPDFEQPFVDGGHLRAVGRPYRAAARAGVHRHIVFRYLPEGFSHAIRWDHVDLVRPFAEAVGKFVGQSDGDIFAVGRPAGAAGLTQ